MSQAVLEQFHSIRPQNAAAASIWSLGAHAYDAISLGAQDAVEHCIGKLEPHEGDRILDLAAGTGWAARRLAERGFSVTAVDFASGMLAAGARAAAEQNLPVVFDQGDAESLPYPDGAFDAVISTFGVIFVAQPEDAAIELARVVRPGGRMALAVWTCDGNMHEVFKLTRRYAMTPGSSGTPSPFAWGKPGWVRALLGTDFDLSFEPGTSCYREADAESSWNIFYDGYGPIRTLADRLNDACREELKRHWIDFHSRFQTESGICMPRDYWVVRGIRR